MNKLYLILNQNEKIVGFFESETPESSIPNMTPTNGSIVSIEHPGDEEKINLLDAIFDTAGSTEDTDNSITDCVHYSTANVTYAYNTVPEWVKLPELWVNAGYFANLQTEAKIVVDTKAEQARLKYITDGTGQAMVYQEKVKDAEQFVIDGYPSNIGDYPFVESEMLATSKTKEEAADDIIAKRDAWKIIGASIERHRLEAKTQIDIAVDKNAVSSIVLAALVTLDAV